MGFLTGDKPLFYALYTDLYCILCITCSVYSLLNSASVMAVAMDTFRLSEVVAPIG